MLAMMSAVYCGPVPVPAVGVGLGYNIRPRPPAPCVMNTRCLALEALATRVATGSDVTTATTVTPPSPAAPAAPQAGSRSLARDAPAPAGPPETPSKAIKTSTLGLMSVIFQLSQPQAPGTETFSFSHSDIGIDVEVEDVVGLTGGVMVSLEDTKPENSLSDKYDKHHKSNVAQWVREHPNNKVKKNEIMINYQKLTLHLFSSSTSQRPGPTLATKRFMFWSTACPS